MQKAKKVPFLAGLASSILCLFIGANMDSFVQETVKNVKSDTSRLAEFNQNQKRIAVINLDTGVEKKGEQIYYANKIIEYPDERYKTTSLEEAKEGMKQNLYGAYIIIPSAFSVSVDSINGRPEKAVFEYKINPNLKEEDREEMIYEIMSFKESISTNVSYIFVDAILDEVHNIQNGAVTVLENDDAEKSALEGVAAEELIEPIEFTELEENNETINPIDLSEQDRELGDSIRAVENNFDNALEKGEKDYETVVSKNKSAVKALEELQKGTGQLNPLYNDKGEYVLNEGIKNVNSEIDETYQRIEGQRTLLENSIVNEINAYGDRQMQGILAQNKENIQKETKEKIFDVLDRKVDTTLEEENLKSRTAAENAVKGYTLDLQKYIDQRLDSQEAQKIVWDIIDEKVEAETERLEEIYLQQMAEAEAVHGQQMAECQGSYEQKITSYKEIYAQKAIEIKGAAENVRNAQEEDYVQQTEALLGLIDAMPQELLLPEETESPENPGETEEPENPGETGGTEEPENPEGSEGMETPKAQNVKGTQTPEEIPEREKVDMTNLKKLLQITGTDQGSGSINPDRQPVKMRDYLKNIPGTAVELSWGELNYSVAPITLEKETKADMNTLKTIEDYYKISKDNVTEAFQEDFVDVIENRNTKIQEEMYGKSTAFFEAQNTYQTQLNQFDPYRHLDRTKLSNDITKISENMSGIVEQMNQTGGDYLQYTADVYEMTNKNIMTLQDDVTKANEKTAENVTKQIGALKESRSTNNRSNSSILYGFTKKLAFTRVGNLPYREAYEFIIDPLEYQRLDK